MARAHKGPALLDEIDVTETEWGLIRSALHTWELVLGGSGDETTKQAVRQLRRKLEGVGSPSAQHG